MESLSQCEADCHYFPHLTKILASNISSKKIIIQRDKSGLAELQAGGAVYLIGVIFFKSDGELLFRTKETERNISCCRNHTAGSRYLAPSRRGGSHHPLPSSQYVPLQSTNILITNNRVELSFSFLHLVESIEIIFNFISKCYVQSKNNFDKK